MSECRYVLDDRGFCVGADSVRELGPDLDQLLEGICLLAEAEESLGVPLGWGSIEVTSDLDLAGLLTNHHLVDRDVGNELLGRLSKCVVWDQAPDVFVDPKVRIQGIEYESYSAAWALHQLCVGKAVGVLTLLRAERGELEVSDGTSAGNVWFVANEHEQLCYRRSIFETEDVPESGFFELAGKAFPAVDFCDGIAFRRLRGAYTQLRPTVLRHLAALNDDFLAAYVAERGNSARISIRIGIDVSIEGTTRESERLMRLRDARFQGTTYRCEWHSKLEPHVNRIHFSPDLHRSRLVVGILVDHLPT